MNAPELSITESGVRRMFRGGTSWIKRVTPYFLPMAPRKKTETEPSSFDRSVILWRAFMTAAVLYFANRDQNAQSTALQPTLQHIEQQLEDMEKSTSRRMSQNEDQLDRLQTQVSQFIDGFRKGQNQGTGGK